jgi:hypothetical protein
MNMSFEFNSRSGARKVPLRPMVAPVLTLITIAATMMAGCSSAAPKQAYFRPDTPFSKVVQGSGNSVCWSVKRAFLTQGYMLDRSGDSAIMSGTKDAQVDDKTNETLRLQATCVDNHNGTSTVFTTAERETSRLQRIKTSVSAGVSIATISYPTSSEDALRVVRRETIQDPHFYDGFYKLVQDFAREDAAQSANSSGVSEDSQRKYSQRPEERPLEPRQ